MASVDASRVRWPYPGLHYRADVSRGRLLDPPVVARTARSCALSLDRSVSCQVLDEPGDSMPRCYLVWSFKLMSKVLDRWRAQAKRDDGVAPVVGTVDVVVVILSIGTTVSLVLLARG